jgi:hypothetical protein
MTAAGSCSTSATRGPRPRNFDTLLAAGPVDVALVPYWWLTEDAGLGFVRDRWRPRHVVALPRLRPL